MVVASMAWLDISPSSLTSTMSPAAYITAIEFSALGIVTLEAMVCGDTCRNSSSGSVPVFFFSMSIYSSRYISSSTSLQSLSSCAGASPIYLSARALSLCGVRWRWCAVRFTKRCQMSCRNAFTWVRLASLIWVRVYGSTALLNVPTLNTCILMPSFASRSV